jgi:LysW-gamma-L-lysine carboxypeptidase
VSESADTVGVDDGDTESDATYTLESVRTTPGRGLLVDLVSTYSPSGEEGPAVDHLVEFFDAHDREVFVDAVGNVRAPADDAVLLTSHVDTVPGEISVRVADGDEELDAEGPVLWGRGSVDATGSLAAMAHAAVQTGVSFVGVVGEEVDSRGAHHLVTDREAPEAVVNGEPSGWDAVALGYRGLVAGEYTVSTESAHGARPDADAIDHATAWWTTVREVVDEESGGGFEAITPRSLAIDGGLADDGESVEASMSVRFRVPPTATTESVQTLVESTTEAGHVEWQSATPPLVGSARSAVATAFRGAIRRAGGTPRHLHKTGTADANHYAEAWDVPVVTYGPGDASLDHTPTERLPLTEFDRATDVLVAVCDRLTE